jgi:hypothetical protein
VRARADPCDLFGCAFRNDPAAAVSPLGPQVDDQIRLGDDVEVVLDDHYGVPRIHQPVQHPDELLDVRHVQADGRLIQDIEGAGRGASRLGQLGDQLDPLRLSAAQRRALLAEGDVAQSHILEQLQRVADSLVEAEELHSLLDAHGQHVGDGLLAEE